MNKYFQFTKTADDVTVVSVFGDITSLKWEESDVTAFDFAKELEEVTTSKLTVRINSYGGEVSQGLAMFHALKRFPGEVTTICEGFACSIASVVFMAGEKRIMNRASLLMIHNAWTIAAGNSADFKKAAEDLDKITQPSIEIYKASSNLSEDEIKALMDDETWITCDEALGYGFATEIVEIEAKQSAEAYFVSHLVEKIKAYEKQLNPKPVEEVHPWDAYFGKK